MWGPGSALSTSLDEGITLLSDYLGQPWRPYELPVTEHYAAGFPSHTIGTMRSALYQEVGHCTRARETCKKTFQESNTLKPG